MSCYRTGMVRNSLIKKAQREDLTEIPELQFVYLEKC